MQHTALNVCGTWAARRRLTPLLQIGVEDPAWRDAGGHEIRGEHLRRHGTRVRHEGRKNCGGEKMGKKASHRKLSSRVSGWDRLGPLIVGSGDRADLLTEGREERERTARCSRLALKLAGAGVVLVL